MTPSDRLDRDDEAYDLEGEATRRIIQDEGERIRTALSEGAIASLALRALPGAIRCGAAVAVAA